MAFSKYNKDRPFLIITRHAKPSAGERTETKDWLETGKWQVEENVIIVDRVTDKHLQSATVIIDILKRSIVKNRFTENEQSEVINHYLKEYSNHVVDGIGIWMKQKNSNIDNAKNLIDDLEDEIGKENTDKLNEITVEVKNEEK